jgi:hypothetical protein
MTVRETDVQHANMQGRAPEAPGRSRARGLTAVVAVALAVAPLPGQGQPVGFSDLVGQGDDYAAKELGWRGYVLTHSDSRDGSTWQYWWNASRKECARLAVSRGRVADVRTTDEHDCDQRSSSGSQGLSDGAKVAIAAAAILGVAALAHKSHENDRNRASQSPQDVAEFERGYRDGMYHQGYHNYNNRPEYRDGYEQGAGKRSAETSYRSPQGGHAGYAPYVNLQDLVGARASSADSDLRSRGFTDKGGYKASGRAYATWWNERTRQCVQSVTSDGRIERFESLYEGNCL